MSTERPPPLCHFLQVSKTSLQPLTSYTCFHELTNVKSRRSGADNPRGKIFDVNRNHLSLRSFATSFKNISLKSDFIHIFSTPFDDEMLMSTGTSCHFGHLLKVSKISLWTLILYFFLIFFMILYMYIARQPPGDKVLMSTERSCHFIHLLNVSKYLFKVWFYAFL